MTDAEFTVISFGVNGFNPHVLGEVMKKKGWKLINLMKPDGLSFTVTDANADEVVKHFTSHLEESIDEINKNPQIMSQNIYYHNITRSWRAPIVEDYCNLLNEINLSSEKREEE